MSPTRRELLAGAGTFGAAAFAGCLGNPIGPPGGAATETTDPCTATDPPKPTTAAVDPRSYPDRPAELTAESVESYVESYERTYRYNAELREYPEKLGRTNDLDVSILDVTVRAEDGRYTAAVSGQLNFGILRPTETPATPTPTPLPIGHRPFETSYAVSDRRVRRADTVVVCW